jgi:hypothetical protein
VAAATATTAATARLVAEPQRDLDTDFILVSRKYLTPHLS